MSNHATTQLSIQIRSGDQEINVTAYNSDNREDWGWMLLPFINALNGAGFSIDPHMIFKHCALTGTDTDAVELACNTPAGRYFGE